MDEQVTKTFFTTHYFFEKLSFFLVKETFELQTVRGYFMKQMYSYTRMYIKLIKALWSPICYQSIRKRGLNELQKIVHAIFLTSKSRTQTCLTVLQYRYEKECMQTIPYINSSYHISPYKNMNIFVFATLHRYWNSNYRLIIAMGRAISYFYSKFMT